MSTPHPNKHTSSVIGRGDWREDFLQKILLLSAVVGLFALFPAVIGESDLIIRAIYIIVYAILVAIILIRLPYLFKASIFITLPL